MFPQRSYATVTPTNNTNTSTCTASAATPSSTLFQHHHSSSQAVLRPKKRKLIGNNWCYCLLVADTHCESCLYTLSSLSTTLADSQFNNPTNITEEELQTIIDQEESLNELLEDADLQEHATEETKSEGEDPIREEISDDES